MSYQLALDESADDGSDVKIPLDGLTFLVEDRQAHLIPGLRIEMQTIYGRRGLVAFNQGMEPAGSCDC